MEYSMDQQVDDLQGCSIVRALLNTCPISFTALHVRFFKS